MAAINFFIMAWIGIMGRIAKSAGQSLAKFARKGSNAQPTARKPSSDINPQTANKAADKARLGDKQKAQAEADKMRAELRQSDMAVQGKDVKTHDGSAPPHVTGNANSSSGGSYNPSGLTRTPSQGKSRSKGREL